MTKIRVFPKNEKGKIEFTKEELQRLLNEVYNEGKTDSYTIYYGYGLTNTTPYYSITTTPYYSTTTTNSSSLSITRDNITSTPITIEVKD